MNLKLTIAGQDLTPSGDVNTALTYEVDGIDGSATGSRSERGVSVVADKLTATVFPPLSNTGAVLGRIPTRQPATLEAGGVVVFRGVAQLLEANGVAGAYGRRDESVKIALLGDNAEWFQVLAKMPIADVVRDYVTGETFTDAFCQANDNADPVADKFGLFLARRLEWLEAGEITRLELTPFVFLAHLFRDAFAAAGYHLDSDFLDGNEGGRYILPLPPRPIGSDYGVDFPIYVADNANTAALPSFGSFPALITLEGSAGNQNPVPRYDTGTGFYEVPYSGHYIITAGGDAANFYGPLTDGVTPVWVTQPVYPGDTHHSERVFLEAGTLIGLFGSALTAGNDAGVCYLQIQPDFVFGPGYGVDLSIFTPDWYVGDALKGFAQIFGLVFKTDNAFGRVRMEPRDRWGEIEADGTVTSTEGFYRDTARTDWTAKIDLSKPSNPKLQSGKSRFRLRYDADGADATTAAIDKGADMKAAEARYLFPVGRYEDGETVETVTFFKKTAMYRAEEIRHTSSAFAPVLPILHTAAYPAFDEQAQSIDPRILYFAGRRGGLDGYVNLRLVPGLSLYDFPAAWFVPYNRSNEDAAPSLAFADELSNFGQPIPGALQRFHLQRMKRAEAGLLLEEWAALNARDIAGLDFRPRVQIGDTAYILRRVEAYRPGNNTSTKILLEADAAPTTADAAKIESSPISALK